MKGHPPSLPHIVSHDQGQIDVIATGVYPGIVSIIAPASVSLGALVTGEIFMTLIWYEGLAAWEDLFSGREIPINKNIYIGPYWISNVTITGHVDLTVRYPDGTSRPLAATAFQDYVGTGHGVQFEPFMSSQEGTYTIIVTLSSGGQVLDSVIYSLVVAAVAVVPCEITITAPDSAAEGETADASVKVKNVGAYTNTYRTLIYAVPDLYPDYVIGGGQSTLLPGDWAFYNFLLFTMPDCNTTVFVWVERWATDHWVYDNSASKVVSLAVPATYHLSVFVPTWAYGGYVEPGSGDYPANSTVTLRAYPLSGYQFLSWGVDASGTSPTYNLYMNSDKYVEAYFEKIPVPVEGTISRKQLEYDEARASIPVYDIPEGQRGLVHIWGRNDTPESQRMGIYWFVADPDGMIAEEYGPAWEAWPYTGAGKEHEFIGGRFNLDREKYTIWVELLMNKDNPEIVDRYIGDLCTVVPVVPEYKGTISKKELEYDETRSIIPVY